MDEWDFEANEGVDPKQTGLSSNRIIAWRVQQRKGALWMESSCV
jgi:hypothetical protein